MAERPGDWILATEQAGGSRHFDAVALPVSFGGDARNDLVLANVAGSVQIGQLDGVFFVQPGRGTTNARFDGELLKRSQRIADGSVIALDTARLTCRLREGRLHVGIEAQITAGDTAPPDIAALTREDPEVVTVSPVAFRRKAEPESPIRARLPNRTALAVYIAFVVLTVLAWFAFTAKSVRFDFAPETAATFDLPGTWFKFQLGDHWMLRAGEHRVLATLPGYYPIDQPIDVSTLANQAVTLEFVRLPGLIAFATEPATAAEVRLDGELIGTTPLTDFEVRPGTHQVQFTAERYLSELVTVEVTGGHEKQTVTAGLTPSWAPVSFSSRPAGAEIRVDGRPLGVTPAELELTAGERQVEVVLAGYNVFTRQVRVVADEPQTIPEIALDLADGRLAIDTTPADASVSRSGEFLGRTPRDLRLAPNVAHALTVAKPGYLTETLEVRLAPGESRRLALELEPQLGEIEVVSMPPGAQIVIDDTVIGVTPLTVERMTIEQLVAVRLEGYADQEQRVTPRPGFAQTVEFDLERLDSATGGGFPREITTGFGQRMRLIPAGGEFQMGSSRSDNDRRQNEALRTVQISQAFYLAETEMTNAQFRDGCASSHDSGTFSGQSLNQAAQPVVNVTVQQVYACLNKLSLAEGLNPVYVESGGVLVAYRPLRNGYRLPTETEFDWASRLAGRSEAEPLRYPWGETDAPPADRLENIADLSAERILEQTLLSYTDGQPVSAPVRSFEPNAVGIYDLGGNVSEWVQDFYELLSTPSTEVQVDPLGPETGTINVIRGPSWQSSTKMRLRFSYRDYDNAPRPDVGFRIARNLQ
jgi:formylglycine-generating enzyme required for sulfatase activity